MEYQLASKAVWCLVLSVHLTGNGVKDHLLGSYLRSLLAVLLAQFDGKGFPGGMDGVVRLVEKCTPIQVW